MWSTCSYSYQSTRSILVSSPSYKDITMASNTNNPLCTCRKCIRQFGPSGGRIPRQTRKTHMDLEAEADRTGVHPSDRRLIHSASSQSMLTTTGMNRHLHIPAGPPPPPPPPDRRMDPGVNNPTASLARYNDPQVHILH
jgi:hypothetical protein